MAETRSSLQRAAGFEFRVRVTVVVVASPSGHRIVRSCVEPPYYCLERIAEESAARRPSRFRYSALRQETREALEFQGDGRTPKTNTRFEQCNPAVSRKNLHSEHLADGRP